MEWKFPNKIVICFIYVKEFDMSKALFKKKKLKSHSQLKTAYT